MENEKSQPSVSVVIPVYNEAASLPELLRRTRAACGELSGNHEIILVDDGSRDGSEAAIAEAAGAEGSSVVAILLNRNYGQHAAIMAGFERAGGEVMVTLDGDLQNPPEEIPRLVEAARYHDVVGTIRRNRQDSLARRLASRVVNYAAKHATGVDMHDYGCMLRAYRRPVIDAMLACHERSTFIPILANSFARRTTELEVGHAGRTHGESKYSPLQLVNLMFDLLTSMTTAPLRLLSIVGCVIAVCGFLLAALLIVTRLVFGAEWSANGVFTLFAILFGFVGAQFIAMGLLGEYIGRMYTDVRARPRYFVQDVIRGTSALNQETPISCKRQPVSVEASSHTGIHDGR